MTRWGNHTNVGKGAVAGAIAGIVASWAMNLFQRSWSEKTTGISKPHGAQALQRDSQSEETQRTKFSNNAKKEDLDDGATC
jgi:hypothetical protein